MDNDSDELERFKREIDLRAYAESLGYKMDPKDSWKAHYVMRRGDDKIKIHLSEHTGHWVYRSFRDDSDSGTILDFAQRRGRGNFGLIRKELREWSGIFQGQPQSPVAAQAPRKSMSQILQELYAMDPVPPHPYLENEKGIPLEVLGSERFKDRIYRSQRGEAIYPHADPSGVCGYERKNRGFKGFSEGGKKGLWISHAYKDDDCLVICESGTEALSYAALFPDDHTSYVSTAGEITAKQCELLRRVIQAMPADSDIVSALDPDEAGQRHHGKVERAFNQAGRIDLLFVREVPKGFKDWSEQLRKSK